MNASKSVEFLEVDCAEYSNKIDGRTYRWMVESDVIRQCVIGLDDCRPLCVTDSA